MPARAKRKPTTSKGAAQKRKAALTSAADQGAVLQRAAQQRKALHSAQADLEHIHTQLEAQNEELRQGERLLEESRDRYAALYDYAPVGYVTLSPRGVILQMNLACAQLLGISHVDSINQPFGYFIHPNDLLGLYAFLRAAAQQIDSTTLEVRMRAKAGRDWYAKIITRPMFDSRRQAIVLWTVIIDITARKEAEEALRRSHAEIEASRERLRALSSQLLTAQENERRAIGRALHDEIGQALTALKLEMQSMPSQPSTPHVQIQADALNMLDWVLQTLRDLSLDLHPSVLDDLGLSAALRWYADRLGQRAGFTVDVSPDNLQPRPRSEVEIVCFRVAQELLTNVVRHAQAQHVRIKLRQHGPQLDLIVADDGRGFDVDAARRSAARGNSLGLISLEERVALAGGQIAIHSIINDGTTVRVRLPLDLASPIEPLEP